MIPVGFGYGEQSMSDPFQPFVSRAPNGFAGGIGNPMQDVFQQFLSAQGQGAGGPQTTMNPTMQPMDRQKQFGGGYSPEMQAYYAQDAANQAERSRRWQMMQGVQGAGQGESPMGVPPVGFAGGGTGMPSMGVPPMGGGLPYNNGFNNPGQPQQPMTQPAVGTPFNKPTGPQVQPPMAQPPAGGGTGTSPQPYNNGFYNPGQPPMAMKKGGFAVKAVWDKKRPKDLGEPKDLSVKRKKSAKARAKAAGRPYPNLIDNMAAARKKGK